MRLASVLAVILAIAVIIVPPIALYYILQPHAFWERFASVILTLIVEYICISLAIAFVLSTLE